MYLLTMNEMWPCIFIQSKNEKALLFIGEKQMRRSAVLLCRMIGAYYFHLRLDNVKMYRTEPISQRLC